MNNPASPVNDPQGGYTRDEILSSLFANMVIQQTNMAMMLLGKVPHPETGEVIHDLESAKMLIDQLEMIEVKTKGNLNKQEDALLKQALAALRMGFVETVDSPAGGVPAHPPQAAATTPAGPEPAPPPAKPAGAPPAEAPPAADESKKKFTKKY